MFVVIEVPSFSDTPHVCQKDYPGTLRAPALYVRTDNNESASVRRSRDFRDLIEQAIRNRSDQLLSSFRAILAHGDLAPRVSDLEQIERQIEFAAKRCADLNPHRDKTYGYRTTAFFPTRFEAVRYDIPSLTAMAKNASVDFCGWPFIFYSDQRTDLTHIHGDALETFLPDDAPFTGGDSMHYWRLDPSGVLYAAELLREDTWRFVKGGERYLDFDRFSCQTAEAIYCLTRLYEDRLEPSEEVALRFWLTDMKDRQLGSSNPARYMHRGLWVSRTETIKYESVRTLADWRAGLTDHALAICQHVFIRFHWQNPNLAESKKLIEKMLWRQG